MEKKPATRAGTTIKNAHSLKGLQSTMRATWKVSGTGGAGAGVPTASAEAKVETLYGSVLVKLPGSTTSRYLPSGMPDREDSAEV